VEEEVEEEEEGEKGERRSADQKGGERGRRCVCREQGGADMPVYLGISCVKGRRGERRGGGGRVEKEVESSTTLAGVTLAWPEQRQLGETNTAHTHTHTHTHARKEREGEGLVSDPQRLIGSKNCPSKVDAAQDSRQVTKSCDFDHVTKIILTRTHVFVFCAK